MPVTRQTHRKRTRQQKQPQEQLDTSGPPEHEKDFGVEHSSGARLSTPPVQAETALVGKMYSFIETPMCD